MVKSLWGMSPSPSPPLSVASKSSEIAVHGLSCKMNKLLFIVGQSANLFLSASGTLRSTYGTKE